MQRLSTLSSFAAFALASLVVACEPEKLTGVQNVPEATADLEATASLEGTADPEVVSDSEAVADLEYEKKSEPAWADTANIPAWARTVTGIIFTVDGVRVHRRDLDAALRDPVPRWILRRRPAVPGGYIERAWITMPASAIDVTAVTRRVADPRLSKRGHIR